MSNNKIFRVFTFVFALLLFISLACGGSSTPELVGKADQEEKQEHQVVEMPPATEEAAPEQSAPVEQPAEEPQQEEAPAPSGPQTFAVGDIVSIGDNVLVVLGWEEIPGDDFSKPDEGKKFIAVEMLVVNQSDSPMSVSTMMQMSLKDETAQQYNVDFAASMAVEDASVDAELSPGEKVRGKVGFQIPQDAKGLQFVFDESAFGSGKVFVDLGSAPVMVEPPAEIAGETQQQAYEIGDIVSIGDSVLVILGWEEVPGNDFSKPDEGKKFIAVETLIVNQSDSPASISSMLQMVLKDATGQQYDPDFNAMTAIDASGPDGELSPGERIRGKVGYQVPQNAENLQFVFDAEVFGKGKVFVNLGPQPMSVEPPAEIVGETAQQTFSVGDIVEIGEFTITVNEVTSPPGDDFSKPDEGKKFVVVDVTVENKSAKAEHISSMLQMSLKDASGQNYDLDLSASMASDGSTPDGELAAGEKLRGQVGFQVPVDSTGLVFVFDADVFGAGKVFVALP